MGEVGVFFVSNFIFSTSCKLVLGETTSYSFACKHCKAFKQDEHIRVKTVFKKQNWWSIVVFNKIKTKNSLTYNKAAIVWKKNCAFHLTCLLEREPRLIKCFFLIITSNSRLFHLEFVAHHPPPYRSLIVAHRAALCPNPTNKMWHLNNQSATRGGYNLSPEVWYHSSVADNVCGLQCNLGDTVAARRRLCCGPGLFRSSFHSLRCTGDKVWLHARDGSWLERRRRGRHVATFVAFASCNRKGECESFKWVLSQTVKTGPMTMIIRWNGQSVFLNWFVVTQKWLTDLFELFSCQLLDYIVMLYMSIVIVLGKMDEISQQCWIWIYCIYCLLYLQ